MPLIINNPIAKVVRKQTKYLCLSLAYDGDDYDDLGSGVLLQPLVAICTTTNYYLKLKKTKFF